MAQSVGDGNSRGLCLLQITTQEILSLGELSRLEHLRLGALSLAHPHKPDNRTVRCTVIKMAAGSTGKFIFY